MGHTRPAGVPGYIGVAAVDGEHQVIVEAQAHGTPQEHDLLKPVIDGVRDHFAAIDETAYLADTGYHSERGLKALVADHIDGYIADGQMRKRAPRYAEAKVRKIWNTLRDNTTRVAHAKPPSVTIVVRSSDTCPEGARGAQP